MKKFLTILSVILISTQPVFAKNVKVQALSDFSTVNPPQIWKVKIIEGFTADNGFKITAGSVIEGKIYNVTPPARLKRNATFVFKPIKFYYSENGQEYTVKQDFVAKYSVLSDISAGSIAKQGAIIAGNKLIDGFFGPGVALVEGAIKNEQGNRAKSAAVSVYESTPFSYISKGKDLEIAKDDIFVMNFKEVVEETNQDNLPNYHYYTFEE